jgi:uncharacterized protein (PEP-CTERM system associated)
MRTGVGNAEAARWFVGLAGVLMLAGIPPSSSAQTARLPEITADGGLTATDNGGLSAPGQEKSDFIARLRPRIALTHRSAGWQLDLAASASLLAYANGTQKNELLPELRASLRGELVERWLYLDAAAEVGQAEASAYGARVDETTGANRQTASAFRVSPYILRDISPTSYVLARYDAGTTNHAADTGARLISNRVLVRYEQKPVPFGAAVEISRLDNESPGFDRSHLVIDTARATASVAFAQQIVLGVVGGVDRNRFADRESTDPLYGMTALWNPGPRTSVAASLEHRFFGAGGALEIRHRTPAMSFVVSLARGPVTVASTLGQLSARSDLRPFLDAILTTRYPDPTTRSGLIRGMVDNRALDLDLPNPINTVAGYPQLQTSAQATAVLLSARNTASVTLFTQTLRQLTHDGEAAIVEARNDNRQTGASIQLSRRLSPLLAVDAIARWSKIDGLAARTGESSRERMQRLVVRRALSPRSGISAGVQHNDFDSNASGQHPYGATLVFVGMSRRF